jgi:nicotinate-nucleotide adenylyltransferase
LAKIRSGIMGGTFDPIHNGHLFLALEAMHVCQLERVLLIPNRVPPHKAAPGVGAEQRWDMLLQAIAPEPRLQGSRMELEREGPSYTLDTVRELSAENELVFICGADAFASKWHRPDAVLEQLDMLLMAHRFGVPPELPAVLAELPEALRAKVRHLDFPDIAISSSDLRLRIAQGRPFRYLVPDAVHRYITEQRLYLGVEPLEGGLQPDEKGLRTGA